MDVAGIQELNQMRVTAVVQLDASGRSYSCRLKSPIALLMQFAVNGNLL